MSERRRKRGGEKGGRESEDESEKRMQKEKDKKRWNVIRYGLIREVQKIHFCND